MDAPRRPEMSLNKVMIIGRLGADPEMRYLQSGSPVTTFRVAANHSWKTPDGALRDETEWFSVVAWNKLAETCAQILTKGARVYIEGRLQTRSWEGQDGQKRYRTEVVANNMIVLSSRQRPGAPNGGGAEDVVASASEELEPDDIPF
jgi:single-strand DNA-binding protein